MTGAEKRIDPSVLDRVLDANLYLVLGTADETGLPWVSPVFFARTDAHRIVWVSSADARHSRNIAMRPNVAVTVFDSTVMVGQAEAVYFDAHAARALPSEISPALDSLNARLPQARHLGNDDIEPHGEMIVYRADLRRRYALVRGGDPAFHNTRDMTIEF